MRNDRSFVGGMLIGYCLLLLLPSFVSAEEPPTAESMSAAEIRASDEKFAGLSFGVGLSVTVDTGSSDRVESASIDANGIVRVDKTENTPARVMLESHYFFRYKGNDSSKEMTKGWGPFVALQPGDDEIITAIGIGMMFGFRRGDQRSGQSFNIGLGFAVDPNSKVLGEEFEANKPAPVDSEGEPLPIRYEERDQGGVLLLVSFSWD